jgi:protease IV
MYTLSEEYKLIAAKAVATFLVVALLGFSYLVFTAWLNEDEDPENSSCNIALIPIVGDLVTLPGGDTPHTVADEVELKVRIAETHSNIKGMLFVVDSLGGYPVASEMIMDAIKRAEKPTVALIREEGTSGAYLATTGADTIIASRISVIGGIGVTQSYVETAGQNIEGGKRFIELNAGKFKDVGNPDKTMTEEDRALVMRDINLTHENFIEYVAANRNITVENVKKLADGSTMMGEMALENKLIDAIGDQATALKWFEEKIGQKAVVCE